MFLIFGLQAPQVRDFRDRHRLASDGDAIREMLEALLQMLAKDPLRDE